MKGIFKPKFPQKYKGNPCNIIYRSSWELRLMSHFDLCKNVIWWSSEEKSISYISPIDNKPHRYFPDFIIHIKNANNDFETIMIEVKPEKQIVEPKKERNKKSKKYIEEVFTYAKNTAKWKAAEEYCRKKGWKFKILTEKDIFGYQNVTK